ncbi:MAG: P1 family peptidase [Candidatus Nanopelagicales bacterium]
MPRASLAQSFGRFPTGPTDSVLDVPGAGLGHATIVRDDPDPPVASGIARTGVTVVDPGGDVWASPIPAGIAVLNGAGELTGSLQIREWGLIETPVFLTSTMQVGRVYDAACRLLMAEQPGIADSVVIPVVGECDDSWLNDPRTMHVTDADVAAAMAQARLSSVGPLAPEGRAALSGCVGAGTGTVCMGWKGGIGTSSRILPDGTTIAVVLLTNFGSPHQLTIRGRVVGEELDEPSWWAAHHPDPAGSCIGVVVTDAPLDSATAARVAARVGLGLARCGSVAHHGSGEIFCCLATGLRAPRGAAPDRAAWPSSHLDDLFEATVDATESAVWDSLLAATTTTGRRGLTVPALPLDRLEALLGVS